MRRLWLVLIALVLAVPAPAGHSFSDPMYTTGDGDFYCLGGLDVDGTCQLDGAITFTAGMTGDKLTLSGTLTVGGAMALTDSLYAGGNVTVADTLVVLGQFKGGRVWLPFCSDTNNLIADAYLRSGVMTNSAYRGWVIPTDCSVAGYAVRYNVDAAVSGASLIEFDIDGVRAFADSMDYTTGTGYYTNTATFARGTHPLTAGQWVSAEWDEAGEFQIDSPVLILDLQLDE